MSKENKQGFFAKVFRKDKKHPEGVLDSPVGNETEHAEIINEEQEVSIEKTSGSQPKAKKKTKREKQASEPLNLYIGYYANVKPKDLREFIFNYATSHITPIENAYYSIQPYMDGYLWEIHEGGSGFGCLKSVKRLLDENDKVTIIRDNFSVVVVRDEDKVSVSKITSSNLKFHKTNGEVEFCDSMKTLVSDGFGFFVSSVIFLAVSSIILGSAFVNRNTERTRLTNEHLYDQIIEPPITQISKMKSYMNNEETGIYIQDLKYNRGKKSWMIKAVPTVDYTRIKTNVVNRVKDSKEDKVDKADKNDPNSFEKLNKNQTSNSKEDALDKLAKKQG